MPCEEEELNQYINAIVLVRNRLEHDETTLGNVEQYIDDAKRTVLEMINGSLSEDDRHAHAQELAEMGNNLFHIANTKDEFGFEFVHIKR